MTIDKDTLVNLAERAKLVMDDSELEVIQNDIKNVIKWLETLKKVNVDCHERFCHYGLNKARLRDDQMLGHRQDLVNLAPRNEQNLIIVPSIINKD